MTIVPSSTSKMARTRGLQNTACSRWNSARRSRWTLGYLGLVLLRLMILRRQHKETSCICLCVDETLCGLRISQYNHTEVKNVARSIWPCNNKNIRSTVFSRGRRNSHSSSTTVLNALRLLFVMNAKAPDA